MDIENIVNTSFEESSTVLMVDEGWPLGELHIFILSVNIHFCSVTIWSHLFLESPVPREMKEQRKDGGGRTSGWLHRV